MVYHYLYTKVILYRPKGRIYYINTKVQIKINYYTIWQLKLKNIQFGAF